jgi:acetyl-CoA acyltransferase
MAKENGIGREAQDRFALRSHQRAAAATEDGRLPAEIVPVYLPREKRAVTKDNHIRPDTTLDALAKLKPAFDKRYGSVTAGNACPVTDGASAMLIMAEDKARSLGYQPMGYVRSYAYSAVDPLWQLLIGPVFAIDKALQRAGFTLENMDLIDLHEAFAAQVLSVTQALGSKKFAEERLGRGTAVGEVDPEKLNVMGGSIALGHPFAATACRQITGALHELERRGKNLAVISQCAAGAMGAAIIVERN